MKTKVYHYPKCSTCRKALSFLDQRDLPYDKIDIVETPPSKNEIKMMLRYLNGEVKKLFNTSGELYREMNIREKLPSMDNEKIISLLNQHGKLIKRPFIITESDGLVGYDEKAWKKLLSVR